MNELGVLILTAALLPAPREPLPTLDALHVFPKGDIVLKDWELAKDYCDRLPRQEVERTFFGGTGREVVLIWSERQQAALYCARAYDLLYTAQNENRPDACRLEALADLKAHIGSTNFYYGRLPPPIPWWLFDDVTGTDWRPEGGK